MSFVFKPKQKLTQRLLPLYIAAFSQGFVLWYAIEKLFMYSIGFNAATIGVMIAAYSAIVLLIETPSGILADRWSRKGVLILGSISLVFSSLIGGLSNDIPVYIISALFWGIFYALYSGTYDSIVYDTTLEETGDSKLFEKQLGRIKLFDGLALVSGSLIGGLLATAISPRATYFLSIPLILISIIALLKFKEPQLHKAEVAVPIKAHVIATFRSIMQRGRLLQVMLVLISVTLLISVVFEFSQLWLIALSAPLILYGPANALILGSTGFGGLIASYMGLHKRIMLYLLVTLLIISSLSLIILQNTAIVITAQVLLATLLIGISIIFTRLLHDSLPSKVRAGASSAVSSLASLVFIPFSLLFGFISQQQSVFDAAWLIFGVVVLIIAFLFKVALHSNFKKATLQDMALAEDYRK